MPNRPDDLVVSVEPRNDEGAPYRLKRIRGVRRVEQCPYGGWIARDQLGNEIMEDGFRWNSRSVAWTVAHEADIFGPFPAALKATPPQGDAT